MTRIRILTNTKLKRSAVEMVTARWRVCGVTAEVPRHPPPRERQRNREKGGIYNIQGLKQEELKGEIILERKAQGLNDRRRSGNC